MDYRDYYTITVKLNDSDEVQVPDGMSFSTIDSIYQLLNTASIRMLDPTGIFQEALFYERGNKVTINYGVDTNINKCSFVIKDNKMDELTDTNIMGGYVDVTLVHAWEGEDEIKSKAYENTISNIITTLTGRYVFKSKNILSSEDKAIWYQPLLTDIEFIKQQLLLNIYSSQSQKTPIYAFITNDNVFNLTSPAQMIQKNPIETYEFYPARSITKEERTTKDIYDVKRWLLNENYFEEQYNRDVFHFSRSDGSISKKEDKLENNFAPYNIIVIRDSTTQKTGYMQFLFSPSDQQINNTHTGQVINSYKKSFFLEEVIIIVPFNPKLKSGETLQLNFYLKDSSGNDEKSLRYSGKYIIEMCEHIWNAEGRMGFTRILAGRRSSLVPSNHQYKTKLLK